MKNTKIISLLIILCLAKFSEGKNGFDGMEKIISVEIVSNDRKFADKIKEISLKRLNYIRPDANINCILLEGLFYNTKEFIVSFYSDSKIDEKIKCNLMSNFCFSIYGIDKNGLGVRSENFILNNSDGCTNIFFASFSDGFFINQNDIEDIYAVDEYTYFKIKNSKRDKWFEFMKNNDYIFWNFNGKNGASIMFKSWTDTYRIKTGNLEGKIAEMQFKYPLPSS